MRSNMQTIDSEFTSTDHVRYIMLKNGITQNSMAEIMCVTKSTVTKWLAKETSKNHRDISPSDHKLMMLIFHEHPRYFLVERPLDEQEANLQLLLTPLETDS